MKLQKLLFLLCQQQEKPTFDFVPYQYGCFSFRATRDLNVLASYYDLIDETEKTWKIKNPVNIELKDCERVIADKLLTINSNKKDNEIVDYVYDKHPYYTINSQWNMTSEQKNRKEIQKAKITNEQEQVLFTTGYEGKNIDAYLNELVKNNISLLCDVRKNPISMKYGFSKKQLEHLCKNLDIAYKHIPELGIASEKRRNLQSKEDYQALFEEYKKTLPEKKESLKYLSAIFEQYRRIALTCFEQDPHDCHRHCISSYFCENKKVICQHL